MLLCNECEEREDEVLISDAHTTAYCTCCDGGSDETTTTYGGEAHDDALRPDPAKAVMTAGKGSIDSLGVAKEIIAQNKSRSTEKKEPITQHANLQSHSDNEAVGKDTIPKQSTTSRRSKLSRWRRYRQQERRAMRARTNADIAKLAEYDSELRIANANRAAHEKRLEAALRLGTNTSVDEIIIQQPSNKSIFISCIVGASEEWPLPSNEKLSMRPVSTGATASSEYMQLIADEGIASVDDKKEQAQEHHHEPKRRDDVAPAHMIEKLGITEEEWDQDVVNGDRAEYGRPILKMHGLGKYTYQDLEDHWNGLPYKAGGKNTIRSLLGGSIDLPDRIADAELVATPPGFIGVLRERNLQLNACSNGGWEKITLIVDSGSSDTVMPQKVCKAAEIRGSSKVGTMYEVADGGVAKNLGEKLCEMKVNEKDEAGCHIAFPVVDKVNKALLSVHRVCSQGNDVVFSEKKENPYCQMAIQRQAFHSGRLLARMNSMYGSGQVEVRA